MTLLKRMKTIMKIMLMIMIRKQGEVGHDLGFIK